MSGCVHCVYTIYAEELETYSAALANAQTALEKDKTPKSDWPSEVLDLTRGVEFGGEGGAEGLVHREERKVESGLDSSMSAFLASVPTSLLTSIQGK